MPDSGQFEGLSRGREVDVMPAGPISFHAQSRTHQGMIDITPHIR